jgi:uracil-DNA glycosylase
MAQGLTPGPRLAATRSPSRPQPFGLTGVGPGPTLGFVRAVAIEPTFEAWQEAARELLRDGVAPGDVEWAEDPDAARPGPDRGPSAAVRVPRRFIELAGLAARHRDPTRWSLLYSVLWRLVHESRDLLASDADPGVRRLVGLAAEVRDTGSRGAAPESPLVLSGASGAAGAAPFVPAGAGLAELRLAARRCTGCDLYRQATQTVFGRGPADARIVLVGEQPGDQEDLQGAPFVGPAGEVLDRALREAGLARERLYVTNAVKHFKFVPRGKRRIHQTPGPAEITACRPWLEAEVAVIQPGVLVCLGASASRALLGPDFRLMRDRGRFMVTPWAPKTLATLHPSAVLRGEDETAQARLYGLLLGDLKLVAEAA